MTAPPNDAIRKVKTALRVVLKFFGSLTEVVGAKEGEINMKDNGTVEDFVETLIREYGPYLGKFVRNRGVVVVVDGRSIFLLDGLETKLSEGATIEIIPLYAGG